MYDYRHIELDRVGTGKKRIVKPPGGKSSDIFGRPISPSPRTPNGTIIGSPPSSPGSSTPSSAPSTPRRGSLRMEDTKNRLFGPAVTPSRKIKDHMKSSIFSGDDTPDSPTPSLTPSRRRKYIYFIFIMFYILLLCANRHQRNAMKWMERKRKKNFFPFTKASLRQIMLFFLLLPFEENIIFLKTLFNLFLPVIHLQSSLELTVIWFLNRRQIPLSVCTLDSLLIQQTVFYPVWVNSNIFLNVCVCVYTG